MPSDYAQKLVSLQTETVALTKERLSWKPQILMVGNVGPGWRCVDTYHCSLLSLDSLGSGKCL